MGKCGRVNKILVECWRFQVARLSRSGTVRLFLGIVVNLMFIGVSTAQQEVQTIPVSFIADNDGGSFLMLSRQHGEYIPEIDKTHLGVDISVSGDYEPQVGAFATGTVIDLISTADDPNFGALGNMVILKHDNIVKGKSVYSVYLHLSEVFVELGEKVAVHDGIGVMGSTGAATGKHIHFEFRFFPERFHPELNNIYAAGKLNRWGRFARKYWVDPLGLFMCLPGGVGGTSPFMSKSDFEYCVDANVQDYRKVGRVRLAGPTELARTSPASADRPTEPDQNVSGEFHDNFIAATQKYSDWQLGTIEFANIQFRDGKFIVWMQEVPASVRREHEGRLRALDDQFSWDQFARLSQDNIYGHIWTVTCIFDPNENSGFGQIAKGERRSVLMKLREAAEKSLVFDCRLPRS